MATGILESAIQQERARQQKIAESQHELQAIAEAIVSGDEPTDLLETLEDLGCTPARMHAAVSKMKSRQATLQQIAADSDLREQLAAIDAEERALDAWLQAQYRIAEEKAADIKARRKVASEQRERLRVLKSQLTQNHGNPDITKAETEINAELTELERRKSYIQDRLPHARTSLEAAERACREYPGEHSREESLAYWRKALNGLESSLQDITIRERELKADLSDLQEFKADWRAVRV